MAEEDQVSSLLVQLLEPLHLRLMSRHLNPTQAGKKAFQTQTQYKAKAYLCDAGGSAVRVQYSLGAGVFFSNFASFELDKEKGKQLGNGRVELTICCLANLDRHIRDRVDAWRGPNPTTRLAI